MALARLRSAAAFAVPLASADRSTRLAVRRTPARSSSSPAAFANGSAAAARSVIAASPGDIDYLATQAQRPWMPGRARRPRSGTRRAGSAPPPSARPAARADHPRGVAYDLEPLGGGGGSWSIATSTRGFAMRHDAVSDCRARQSIAEERRSWYHGRYLRTHVHAS
jgi:hypothetical protein